MKSENTNSRKSRRIKNKKNRKKIIISVISIVLVILIGSITGYYFYVKSKIYTNYNPNRAKVLHTVEEPKKEKEVEYKEVKGITNILLIGTDGRTLDENSRADSVIIATVDNNNKKVKLTSLFRDTLVNIPGHGEYKLNESMALGGKELLMETVSQTYNLDIDKYIIINFWGFEAIIDQIGGLEIDVKDYQLNELNRYIGESTSGNDCPVENSGLQLLNGKQALSYARIRKGVGDDYERTERQREVIFKVVEKLKETRPSKYLGIMNKMLDHINTNIDPLEALNLAYTIFKFPSLDTEQLQMPILALASDMNYKHLGSVLVMDRLQNAKILHEFIFEDKTPNEEEFDYYSFYSAIGIYESEQSNYQGVYGSTIADEEEAFNNLESYYENIDAPPIQVTPEVQVNGENIDTNNNSTENQQEEVLNQDNTSVKPPESDNVIDENSGENEEVDSEILE